MPSPVFTTRAVYTEGPSFWGKMLNGLGTVVTRAAHLAREAVPYVGEAATLYVAKPNVPILTSMPDFSTYHGQSIPINQPGLTPLRPLPDYKPSRIGEKAVARMDRSEPSLQRSKQWQAMQNQAIRTLNQMAQARGLPSYEQFQRENGVVYKFCPDQSDMGVKHFLASSAAPQARRFLSEPNAPIQGAQQSVSYAHLLKARIQQSSEPPHAFTAKKSTGTRQSSSDQSFRRKPVASQVQQVVQQAFADPRQDQPDILQQARLGRVAEYRMAQVELNLANMKAQGQMTPEQQAQLEIGAKALFAANWLRHDGQDAGKGNITYRGITVERSLAPMLAYADAEQYWQQNTHLSPKQDWMKDIENLSNGATWLNLLHDWFFEIGTATRIYGINNPITQDLMKDEGVQQAKAAWIQKGKQSAFRYFYTFGIKEYLRELATLDGTGSTLGGYVVNIKRLPNHIIQITVNNVTGWESGTHLLPLLRSFKFNKNIPNSSVEGMLFRHQQVTVPKSILEDRNRVEAGPGGNFEQKYIWYEKE